MPLPAVVHCCSLVAWIICLALFIFRKNLRIAHSIIGVGLMIVPCGNSLSGIYLYNAYRVADDEIRFFFMQKANEKHPLQFLDVDEWQTVETTCVCPLATLISQCTVEAHLGIIRTNNSKALILRVPRGTVEREIDVIDVRPQFDVVNRDYPFPHQMGICVQPIYYHADWPAFVQFFEYWIATGATKFYIYLHSATPQVRKVLEYYSQLLGSGLEIISWSDLPVAARDRGDFSADPNTRVFRAGAYSAINDCLLRARWSVKYLAMLDIDEVLVTDNGANVVERIEEAAECNPFAATFSLKWKYGVVNEKGSNRIRIPRQLSFDSLSNIKVLSSDNVNFDYGRLRKIIQRPERVRITDIHNTLENESFSFPTSWVDSTELTYQTTMVNSTTLSVLHMRRFHPRSQSFENTLPAAIDANILALMIENLGNRSALLDVDMGQWWRTSEQTMAELESCRKKPFNLGTRIGKGHCRSLANCESTLSSAEAFVKEPSVWTNVACAEKFIQYVVL